MYPGMQPMPGPGMGGMPGMGQPIGGMPGMGHPMGGMPQQAWGAPQPPQQAGVQPQKPAGGAAPPPARSTPNLNVGGAPPQGTSRAAAIDAIPVATPAEIPQQMRMGGALEKSGFVRSDHGNRGPNWEIVGEDSQILVVKVGAGEVIRRQIYFEHRRRLKEKMWLASTN